MDVGELLPPAASKSSTSKFKNPGFGCGMICRQLTQRQPGLGAIVPSVVLA